MAFKASSMVGAEEVLNRSCCASWNFRRMACPSGFEKLNPSSLRQRIRLPRPRYFAKASISSICRASLTGGRLASSLGDEDTSAEADIFITSAAITLSWYFFSSGRAPCSFVIVHSPKAAFRGASRSMVASRLDMRASSLLSRTFSPSLPLISSACSKTPSRVP